MDYISTVKAINPPYTHSLMVDSNGSISFWSFDGSIFAMTVDLAILDQTLAAAEDRNFDLFNLRIMRPILIGFEDEYPGDSVAITFTFPEGERRRWTVSGEALRAAIYEVLSLKQAYTAEE